jgi:hypothetical protein
MLRVHESTRECLCKEIMGVCVACMNVFVCVSVCACTYEHVCACVHICMCARIIVRVRARVYI